MHVHVASYSELPIDVSPLSFALSRGCISGRRKSTPGNIKTKESKRRFSTRNKSGTTEAGCADTAEGFAATDETGLHPMLSRM